MTNYLHKGDIPADIDWGNAVAVDTEAMGLNNLRDRLCVVQMSSGDGDAHLVHFPTADYDVPNLKKLMADNAIQKMFHFARFDVAIIKHYLGVKMGNVYCTKIASKLCRTYTDRHGLKDLCRELLNVELSKQQQSSDWGAPELTEEQVAYAASDVLYLHALKENLEAKLQRAGRAEIARQTMAFLPVRAELDLMGWSESDIFSHAS